MPFVYENMADNEYTVWERLSGFGSGQLEDEEVKSMLEQTRAAADYMFARSPRYELALTDAIMTERDLRHIAVARGLAIPEWSLSAPEIPKSSDGA